MSKPCQYLAASLFLLTAHTGMAAERIGLSQFAQDSGPVPQPWQAIPVSDKLRPTNYNLVRDDGVIGIEAKADRSMSMLGRPLPARLENTTVLCWRWKIDAPLRQADMTRKSGDDYAARVYVALAVPSDRQSFTTRAKLKLARSIYGPQIPDAAINYVWDNRQPAGTLRANAYTELTQMIVVQSGAGQAGRWVEVRRDLASDIERAFPARSARPTLLAIASDTDNTGERARAVFADFHLVPRGQACAFPPATP